MPREASVMRLVGFERPIDAVMSYANNLNTHPAYEEFRRARAAMRSMDMPLDSIRLVGTLHRYSERRADYIRDVRRLITHNNLTDFDTAQLEDGEEARQVAER
jgi:Bax protein